MCIIPSVGGEGPDMSTWHDYVRRWCGPTQKARQLCDRVRLSLTAFDSWAVSFDDGGVAAYAARCRRTAGWAVHSTSARPCFSTRCALYVSAPGVHDKMVTSSRLRYGSAMQEAPVARCLLRCVPIA